MFLEGLFHYRAPCSPHTAVVWENGDERHCTGAGSVKSALLPALRELRRAPRGRVGGESLGGRDHFQLILAQDGLNIFFVLLSGSVILVRHW